MFKVRANKDRLSYAEYEQNNIYSIRVIEYEDIKEMAMCSNPDTHLIIRLKNKEEISIPGQEYEITNLGLQVKQEMGICQ